MTALNELTSIDPLVWSGREGIEIEPHDLSLVINNGFDCDSRFPPSPEVNDPRRWMPWDESSGGAFCFDSLPYEGQEEAFITLMKSLGISDTVKTFSAYIEKGHSRKKQMRIVSRRAMKSVFKVINEEEYQSFPEQEVSMAEAMWLFLLDANPPRKTMKFNSPKPGKTMMISLIPPSIGIMVENSYYDIYRIWSRWPAIRQ